MACCRASVSLSDVADLSMSLYPSTVTLNNVIVRQETRERCETRSGQGD